MRISSSIFFQPTPSFYHSISSSLSAWPLVPSLDSFLFLSTTAHDTQQVFQDGHHYNGLFIHLIVQIWRSWCFSLQKSSLASNTLRIHLNSVPLLYYLLKLQVWAANTQRNCTKRRIGAFVFRILKLFLLQHNISFIYSVYPDTRKVKKILWISHYWPFKSQNSSSITSKCQVFGFQTLSTRTVYKVGCYLESDQHLV